MWMVKRWEDDQKVAVAVTDEVSRLATPAGMPIKKTTQTTLKSRSTAIVKNFQRRSDSFRTGSGSALGTCVIMSYINLFAVTKTLKCGRTPSITIAVTTPSVTIQHIRAINGRTGTYLKLNRVCDGM
jgi:mevalonate pyrophosphate decarboxylase